MAQSYHTKGAASTARAKPTPAPVQVVQDYHSAVNAIIEPDKFVACTRYFVRRWMPLLGNEGTRIVLALRSLGFHNPATGETRNGIEIELPDLAALCGTSLPTLKREFGDKPGHPGVPRNPALRRFVQKESQYWRDPVTNRLLRTANVYRVLMDDPLHEDDEPRLNELLRAQDIPRKLPEAQNEPQMPGAKRSKAQNELQTPAAPPSEAHNELREAHYESETNQNEPRAAQNEPALIDYSSLPKITSSTAALPGDSTSSFEDLTDTERSAWEAKAHHQFAANGVPTPGARAVARQARALWAKSKP